MAAMDAPRAGKTSLVVTPGQVSEARRFDTAALAGIAPEELSSILSTVVRIIADGGTVTIGSTPPEVTTTTAASMLGVSRPTLMKLIRAGELSAYKVGTHTRLKSADVTEYADRRSAARRAALDELRDYEDALGISD